MIRSEKLNEGILPIILDQDIIGKDKIIDITKLPHLLIAGTNRIWKINSYKYNDSFIN